MPVDKELLEILACPACKAPVTLVKERHRPEMRLLSPRVSDQGRHSGDADRRGNDRTLKILLIRLRLIGDVVFTTPAIGALAAHVSRRAHRIRRRASRVAGGRAQSRPERGDRRRASARRAGAHPLRPRARQAAAGAALRPGHRLSRRPAQRAAHARERRADAHRLRPARARLVLHETRAVDAIARAAASLGAEPVGSDHAGRRAGPASPASDPVRMVVDAECRRARRPRDSQRPESIAAAPVIVVHVSAGNPFRRWPAASFATTIAGSRRKIRRDGLSSRLDRPTSARPAGWPTRRGDAPAMPRPAIVQMWRVRSGRAASPARSRGALHRR